MQEYSINGIITGLAIRLRNGEEWKVSPQSLGPSRLEEIQIQKSKARLAVIDSVNQFLATGLTYKEARNRTGDKLALSAKSVSRYWMEYQRKLGKLP